VKKIKTLYWDVETSLMKVSSFSLWPNYIDHNAIIQDWHIICAAWKWKGNKKIHGSKTHTTDDKQVVKDLREALEEADEIVYHNGAKFDWKKFNTRLVYHGLSPLLKPQEVDTLKQARKHFSFTSNRLDYLAQFFGVGSKMETSSNLWGKALDGNKKAINEMYRYNKVDVDILEKVHERMEPYIDTGFNRNLNSSSECCSKCGSNNLKVHANYYTKVGVYKYYRCNDCKSFTKGTKRIRGVQMK